MGLVQIHKLGRLHSDIKPANFLVPKDPKQTKLIDFGFSSLQNQIVGSFVPQNIKEDKVFASPHYAALEVLNNEPAGITSDTYSFGMSMIDLIHPFFSSDFYHLHSRNKENLIKRIPEDIRNKIPQIIIQLLMISTSPKITNRIDALTFVDMLETGIKDIRQKI